MPGKADEGRFTLHLTARWPWRDAFAEPLTRIHALRYHRLMTTLAELQPAPSGDARHCPKRALRRAATPATAATSAAPTHRRAHRPTSSTLNPPAAPIQQPVDRV